MNYFSWVLWMVYCSLFVHAHAEEPYEVPKADTLKEGYGNIMEELHDIKSLLAQQSKEDVPAFEQTTHGADTYTDRPGQVTMVYDGSFINVRVEHSWPVNTSRWTLDRFLLPEQSPGVDQETGDGSVYLRVPADNFRPSGGSFRDTGITLSMIMYDNNFFHLTFGVDTLFPVRNVSDLDEHNDKFTPLSRNDAVYLIPLKIGGGLQRSYHPGEEVDVGITIDNNAMQQNATDLGWNIYYFKDGVLNRLSGSCGNHDCGELVTMEPSEDPFTLKATLTVNTTDIADGALLHIGTYIFPGNRGTSDLNNLVSMKSSVIIVYLRPVETNEAVPFGSLAFDERQHLKNMRFSFDRQNVIGCIAFGNPTPNIEILYEGRPAAGERSEQVFSKYVDQAYLRLDGQPTENIVKSGFTCRASNTEKVVDFHIDVYVRAEVVDELTKIERESEKELTVTCAVRGIPEPNVKFYENWMGTDSEVNSTATNGVTMATQIDGNTVVKQMWVNLDKYQTVDEYGNPRHLYSFVCGDGLMTFKEFYLIEHK